MKLLWLRFVSWLHGRKIGEIRYVKALPAVVGDIRHMLPPEIWTETERNSVRCCVNKQRWDGAHWRFVERLELTWQDVAQLAEGKK